MDSRPFPLIRRVVILSLPLDTPQIDCRWRLRTVCGMVLVAVLFLPGCGISREYNTVDVSPPPMAQNDIGHSHPLAGLPSPDPNVRVEPVVASVSQASAVLPAATLHSTPPPQEVNTDWFQPPAAPVCQPGCCQTDCCRTSLSPQLYQALYGPPPKFNFRSDFHNCWGTLVDDAKSTVTWKNAFIMGAATGAAIGIHQDWDDKVRAYTAEHPSRWGSGGEGIGYLGDFTVQIPVLAGLYSYSLWDQNEELHDLSSTLISAYAVTTTATTLIKVAVNSDRPSEDFNGGKFGFPSYHTSSSFALASVLDKYYGPKAGLPAYTLAGVIAWTRIDERDHDLSDVVFGAVLGTVIGRTIAAHHLGEDTDVVPFYEPESGAAGVAFGVNY